MRRLAPLLFVFALPLAAANRPYHLALEANPAAPFPFLGRFGTVTIDVYPSGVRAETFWVNGFSRNGSTVTLMNPFSRMYTEMTLTEVGASLQNLAGKATDNIPPWSGGVIAGKVGGVDAHRYRLMYGAQAWIDVWTTDVIAPNAQLRALVAEFVRGIHPASVAALRAIPGTPLYVELNFRRYKKLPLLRFKELTFDASGEDDALRVGHFYFKAPMLEAFWK